MIVYLDAANLADIEKYWDQVEGFTTNPSLMKKAGITNYREFAHKAIDRAQGKPISFEVLADDFPTMERQAQEISDWSENVYVKIPIMNSKGESSIELIDRLQDLRLNITAVMTQKQMEALSHVVWSHHIVSIFSGRIRDANGQIPEIPDGFKAPCLWASTRQTFDMSIAEAMDFKIITMTPQLIEKLPLRGKDLHEYSRQTVAEFVEAGKGITF